MDRLAKNIKTNRATIGVLGLGYVGLPLSLLFSTKFRVIGYDPDLSKIRMLRKRRSNIDDVSGSDLRKAIKRGLEFSSAVDDLRECDVIIVCVPTPLNKEGLPDLTCIKKSSRIVGTVARRGMLVVLESTSYPGTTEEFLGTAIKEAGLVPGRDVALAFSPERVDPGNTKYDVSRIPKLVGGVDKLSTDLTASLYAKVIRAGVVKVSNCRTAEAAKLLENIFRGTNIALINEMALIFERLDIDTWEVVRAAATKPFGFLAHYPGPGVGGQCIPLNPGYLSFKARQLGVVPRLVELSMEINESMKDHTVDLALAALKEAGVARGKATVAVMGLAYKANVSDARRSPSIGIVERLSGKVGKVLVHDPRVSAVSTAHGRYKSVAMSRVLRESDCLVFVTPHSEYLKLKPSSLRGRHVKAIVDTRSMFDKGTMQRGGLIYRAIGK